MNQATYVKTPKASVLKGLDWQLLWAATLLRIDAFHSVTFSKKGENIFILLFVSCEYKSSLSCFWFQVSDWWEEYIYLRSRGPIMVNSNYYGMVNC